MESKIYRKTLKSQIVISGIGLHSGKKVSLKLIPAEANTGLIFISNVKNKKSIIPVSLNHVVDTSNAVTLGDGFRIVQTVEHLMAALSTRGITDLIMEIDSSEIPIMDGSSQPFLEAIDSAGIIESNELIEPIKIANPIWVVDGDKYIVILPSETLKVTYNIHFNHPLLRGQSITIDLDESTMAKEILPARTFGFLRDVEALQARGLALGGSLDNAIVLSDEGYLNESLRFENECIRHKVLDLIGDLSIVGRPIVGHIIASKAGHALDVSMGKLVMSRITGDEISKFKSKRIHDFRERPQVAAK
ncbi:MAG TPA: UDP-3-O-acyl-N-acetylglucosamine deacetylase [Leptospiraceae bacterium]|nr:UDP-3-O-acyl-N-acetylglucosamine deacetylase [Leptospiraceae bacterium]HMW04613.1 UDP-3-O-acyl-N-acetylglucosamine deacetylase [Leptospiraceae bacterium]HMX31666.1 UDP-3-O-acyl-N-acetylglucosamine deacetylase [Leptospiraceae bacterium]HMY30450.1 UDP-3-O-acyl-N-acetylglucosamine deacetylase [Leptospiraceae bacterium]HMZ67049.1 UDP-3-O-acyl-N-acetylglucosamine deacetylase [Leptospiraceae bacterium]